MRLRKRPSSGTVSQRAESSGTVSQRADKKITQPGETSTSRADKIMDEIRSLGSYPRESGATRNLAIKRRKAEAAGEFSISQLEEQKTMKEQQDEKARSKMKKLVEEIEALGYIPNTRGEHSDLYYRWRRAVQSGKLTPEQIQAAEALTAESKDPRFSAV